MDLELRMGSVVDLELGTVMDLELGPVLELELGLGTDLGMGRTELGLGTRLGTELGLGLSRTELGTWKTSLRTVSSGSRTSGRTSSRMAGQYASGQSPIRRRMGIEHSSRRKLQRRSRQFETCTGPQHGRAA